MAYKVTATFRDKEDGLNLCREGEAYPREGLEVSDERFAYLVDKGFIKDLDALTKDKQSELDVPTIKVKLDELGIKYNAKAKKAELLALLEEAEGE